MNLLATLVLVAAAGDQPPIEAFFTEFAKQRDRVSSLEARFTQRTITPDETFISEGSVIYARPKRILFRYEDPEETYVIDNLTWYEYIADLQQLRIVRLEDRPEAEALFLGFDDDTARLREAYHIELIEPASEVGGLRHLVLRPKADDTKGVYFEQVTLYLREEDYLPARVEIINDAESRVIHEFRDFRINPPFDAHQTQIDLPEGTKIIENEEFVRRVSHGGVRVPGPVRSEPLPDAPSGDELTSP